MSRGMLLVAAVLACAAALATAQNIPPCAIQILVMPASQQPACTKAFTYVQELQEQYSNNPDGFDASSINNDTLCDCAVLYSKSEVKAVQSCYQTILKDFSSELTEEQTALADSINFEELQENCKETVDTCTPKSKSECSIECNGLYTRVTIAGCKNQCKCTTATTTDSPPLTCIKSNKKKCKKECNSDNISLKKIGGCKSQCVCNDGGSGGSTTTTAASTSSAATCVKSTKKKCKKECNSDNISLKKIGGCKSQCVCNDGGSSETTQAPEGSCAPTVANKEACQTLCGANDFVYQSKKKKDCYKSCECQSCPPSVKKGKCEKFCSDQGKTVEFFAAKLNGCKNVCSCTD